MIITIIDTILCVLIYGSIIVLPALFCIHMQIAWENHIDSYYAVPETSTPYTPQTSLKSCSHPQYKTKSYAKQIASPCPT